MEKVLIPADRRCAREARRFVQRAAGSRLTPEQCSDAMLVVSELATNCFRHAGTDMTVTVECFDDRIRIGVADGSDSLPAPRTAGTDEPDGRGLDIVDRLADRWGVTLVPSGKQVWCDLRVPYVPVS